MSQQKAVSIPTSLFEQLEEALPQTAFSSVDDLVLFIIQTYLEQNPQTKEISAEEEEGVRERLRNLGYL
jgi:metal-responsive CopG/Arc/MetJ family transcriptional regulator